MFFSGGRKRGANWKLTWFMVYFSRSPYTSLTSRSRRVRLASQMRSKYQTNTEAKTLRIDIDRKQVLITSLYACQTLLLPRSPCAYIFSRSFSLSPDFPAHLPARRLPTPLCSPVWRRHNSSHGVRIFHTCVLHRAAGGHGSLPGRRHCPRLFQQDRQLSIQPLRLDRRRRRHTSLCRRRHRVCRRLLLQRQPDFLWQDRENLRRHRVPCRRGLAHVDDHLDDAHGKAN